MAAKKRRVVSNRSAPAGIKIVRAPAPIVRVSAPRAPAKRRRSHPRRRSSGIGGGIISNETVQMAIGGALYGYCVKSGIVDKLPAIPVLGRTGTAAILLDYFSRHGGGQLAGRAARAAAAIAGYQLGSTGKISGDLTTTGDFAMGTHDDASTPGSMAGDDDGY